MLRLVIVDDEYSIIELVKNLIECPDVQIVGEAQNGIDAYPLVLEMKPDVLITDISMPGCSGIELIEKIKMVLPEIEIIVISGYRDFEYARSALKSGAKEYLLKPIKKNELNSILYKLAEEQKGMVKERQDKEVLENKLEKSVQELRQKFLLEQINDNEKNAEDSRISELFNFKEGIFGIAILKMDFQEWSFLSEKQTNTLLENTCEKILLILKTICYDAEYLCYDANGYFLYNYNQTYLSKGNKEIQLKMDQLKTLIKNINYKYGFLRFVLGIGEKQKQVEDIKRSYISATWLLHKRINKNMDVIIDFAALKDRTDYESEQKLTQSEYQDLEQTIKKLDIPKSLEVINGCINNRGQKAGEYSWIYVLSKEMVISFNRIINSMGTINDYDFPNEKEIIWKINSSSDVDTIKGFLENYLKELFDFYIQKQSNKESKQIRIIKEYVERNYAAVISLEDIANIVFLSPVYVSAVFKAQTGMGFTSYLIQVRIEKAKELLRGSLLTVSEIAQKVGYSDPRHFSKLFKKQVGIKPVEYRKFYS